MKNNENGQFISRDGHTEIGLGNEVATYDYSPRSDDDFEAITLDSQEFHDVKRALDVAINEAIKEAGSGNVVTINLRMEVASPCLADEVEKEISPIRSVITIKSQKQIDKYDKETYPLMLIKDQYGYKSNRRQMSIWGNVSAEEE